MTIAEACAAYRIDPKIVKIWQKAEGNDLLPIQERAISEGGLLEGQSLLIVSPTSSGKTFVAEMAAIKTAFEGRKVLVLMPIKALVEEKFRNFRDKYAAFGLQIAISTREHREFDDDILMGHFDIALLVYEKLDFLLLQNPDLLRICGLVIVDEIQMIADPHRGGDLELLLTQIRLARRDSSMQLIGLSAVLGQLNGLDAWLDAKAVAATERPVELLEGVYHPSGSCRFKAYNTGHVETRDDYPVIEIPEAIVPDEKENIRGRVVAALAAHLVEQGQQVLIYRKWRRLTRETTQMLVDIMPNKPVSRLIKNLALMEETLSKSVLMECLRHGVAFHNADLSVDERRAIETEFRRDKTPLRIIVATSTLGMGVNLPVDSVIVTDPEMIDALSLSFQEMPLAISHYKNLSGRAGRLKLNDRGQSFLVALSDFEAEKYWRLYVEGDPANVEGQLDQRDMLDNCLRVLARKGVSISDDVHDYLLQTYTGYTLWGHGEQQTQQFMQTVSDAFKQAIRERLMRELPEVDHYELTNMGRICVEERINAVTFVRFRDWLTHFPSELSVWHLIFICAHAREIGDVPVRLSTAAYQEGRYLDDLTSKLQCDPEAVQDILQFSVQKTGDRYDSVKKLKISLEMLDWIEGRPYIEIEKYYNKDYEDKVRGAVIRELGEMMSWLISAMARVAEISEFDDATVEKIEILAARLLFGLPEAGLELAFLRIPELTRNVILQLIKHDITLPDQLMDLSPEEADGVIPRTVLLAVQESLSKMMQHLAINFEKNHVIRLQKVGVDPSTVKNVYQAHGKKLEFAIEALLSEPPLKLSFQRIVDQKFGEPDHLLHLSDETIPFEIASTSRPDKKISLKKSSEILHGAARYRPQSLVVIGKPDFHELAIRAADEITAAYHIKYKLMTLDALIELYVRFCEDRLTRAGLIKVFQEATGYLNCETLNRYLGRKSQPN